MFSAYSLAYSYTKKKREGFELGFGFLTSTFMLIGVKKTNNYKNPQENKNKHEHLVFAWIGVTI